MLADGLVMPKRAIGELSAVTQQLSPTFGVNVSYSHTKGMGPVPRAATSTRRCDGVRPDPALGNITQVESTARTARRTRSTSA